MKIKTGWINLLYIYNKHIQLVVKDTKPDGNCQFRSIAEATGINHKILRKRVALYILKTCDNDEFNHITMIYQNEKKYGDFRGQWDPDKIQNRKDLATEVMKSGFNFEGDDITMSILSKILKLDFLILTESNRGSPSRFARATPLGGCEFGRTYINKIQTPGNRFFAMLNYIGFGNGGHYKTIGFKLKNRVKTIFNIMLFSKIVKIISYKINAPEMSR